MELSNEQLHNHAIVSYLPYRMPSKGLHITFAKLNSQLRSSVTDRCFCSVSSYKGSEGWVWWWHMIPRCRYRAWWRARGGWRRPAWRGRARDWRRACAPACATCPRSRAPRTTRCACCCCSLAGHYKMLLPLRNTRHVITTASFNMMCYTLLQ